MVVWKLLIPVLLLIDQAVSSTDVFHVGETRDIEIIRKFKSVKINCGANQFHVSQIPRIFNVTINMWALSIQNCILPKDSLYNVSKSLGAAGTSKLKVENVVLVKQEHLAQGDFEEIFVNRSELTTDAFAQQFHCVQIQVVNSKITLSEISFEADRNLRYLTINRCNITHLPAGMFKNIPNLIYLVLEKNSITEVSTSTFEGLQNLENLNLKENQLTVLPGSFLHFMPLLKFLDLGKNPIRQIIGNELQESSITHLYFTGNTVPLTFGQQPLGNIQYLYWIDLTNCGIATLPSDLLYGTNVQHLFLSNNLIDYLPEMFFEHQSNLKNLLLNENLLRELPLSVTSPLTQLQWLEFDNNRLTEIYGGTFSHMRKLYYLSMKGNKLTRISQGAFSPSLVKLHLDDNQLTTLEMPLLPSLDTLTLRNNSFSTVSSKWRDSLPALRLLDLSGNKFIHLTESDIIAISHCSWLDLKYNEITSVVSNVNTTLPPNLWLEGASLVCDCNLREFAMKLRDLNVENDAVCAAPTALSGSKLTSLLATDFIC